MKVGLGLGYWKAEPPRDLVERICTADELGFDSVWVAESWGSDAFVNATWVAAHTSNVRIGTGVVQMGARTPTATAMAAVTIDHLSRGRLILGLGVSGPQVVEGWYGRPSDHPLARTKEYVEVIRAVLRREKPLEYEGDFYQFPYTGPGSVGLGKPLRIMTHPYREDLPIVLGAEGVKNVTQTAQIADGWLPLYYSPFRQDVYSDQLAAAKPGFEVFANVSFVVTDDVSAALQPLRSNLGFYIGGMGAKGQNYHTKLMARMGFEKEASRIQELFFAGRREDAIAAVPEEFADEISLVGPVSRIRRRLEAWHASPVTTLVTGTQDVEQLRLFKDLVTA